MRIDRIELSWFRGAAEKAILEANAKSLVVYGDTASGKSSFVDAIEYILSNGKIEHLRHEYSDRHYRNCVRNTKTPDDEISEAGIYFENGNYVKVEVPKEGRTQFESDPQNFLEIIQNWGVWGHILRQDEVSDFIKETKSKKYSVLSPLLSLSEYEEVAENINKIRKNVIEESDFAGLKGEYRTIDDEIKTYFNSLDYEEIKKIILERANKYFQASEDEDIVSISERAISELTKLSKKLEPDIKRYIIIQNIHKINLKDNLDEMISFDEELSKIGDEFIGHKIAVLENANKILDSIEDLSVEIECPACGRAILGTDFKEHVTKELDILKKSIEMRNKAIKNRRQIISALSNISTQCKSEKVFVDWLSLPEKEKLKDLFKKLDEIKTEDPLNRWSNNLVKSLKEVVSELYLMLQEELKTEPPAIEGILDDNNIFQSALKMPKMKKLGEKITKIEILTSNLERIYKKVREKISVMTDQKLSDITNEIRRIWSIMHPGELIKDIKLSPSTEKDRAIDICLEFYGTNQLSPRLTLSEGYRNSLGLSIFLALANQEDNRDHPIILDDIVSSLDRGHRGMIVDLLREELAGRQIFLFTHDREWYDELVRRLSRHNWKFFTLQKWTSPETGLQLIPSHYTFEEAESFLPNKTNASGNAVRAIMDTELPIAAEKMELLLPHQRGVRNDHRTCTEFVEKFISEGRSRFKIKKNGNWEIYQEAIDCWEEAKELLITWANRASHGGILTPSEARKLIEVCRASLSYYDCPNCGRKVWKLSHPEYVQCECGQIRWKI